MRPYQNLYTMEGDGECAVWSELSDEALVAMTRAGFVAAFDELVRRYRPAVRLTARRYAADPESGEDLCQEAFLRAFKALAGLQEPARFGAWLHAITRNLALQERRNGARHQEHLSFLDLILLEGIVDPDPSPHELAERSEIGQFVRQAVETLPTPYREVVYLHYWE